MAKLKVIVSTRKVGSRCDDTVELDADEMQGITFDEVNDIALQSMFEMIEWNWRLEDDDGNEIVLPGE